MVCTPSPGGREEPEMMVWVPRGMTLVMEGSRVGERVGVPPIWGTSCVPCTVHTGFLQQASVGSGCRWQNLGRPE